MSNLVDIDLIISKLKNHLGIKKDKEFADYLGVSPQAVSTWKARNTIDYALIFAKCEGINANWLMTGVGPMFIKNKPPSYIDVSLAEPDVPYNNCPYCMEKDKIISVLQKELDKKDSTINKLIDVLHQTPERESSNEYEQKRKAS